MARALRIERAGAWYHVTARGNERRAIYRDQRDRRHFCELLGETVVRFRLVLHAYVLTRIALSTGGARKMNSSAKSDFLSVSVMICSGVAVC